MEIISKLALPDLIPFFAHQFKGKKETAHPSLILYSGQRLNADKDDDAAQNGTQLPETFYLTNMIVLQMQTQPIP